ncbi:MAG: peptide chain release factor 1 [Holosporales bacterium]|jgi:peptide chain release factor 1|nr:peptide chain release factor 1 [Holosporales bacterium]
MSIKTKLDQILLRYENVGAQLSKSFELSQDDLRKLSKEFSDLSKIAGLVKELRCTEATLAETKALFRDTVDDPELRELANNEVIALKERIDSLNHQILIMLLPKDTNDERNAIIEIRAGTGGDEAGLFAADLLRMYQRYAAIKGWGFEIMSSTDFVGSLREAVVSVTGADVFARLKFESGVHRVQRVPDTEASGRIHTSAATVAVLPEAEEIDVIIDEKDLQIDVYRASGAGGQHVNKTESAIRITHIPTGLVVTQQDDRSQHRNKAKAMKILRARLYDLENEKANAERAADRKSQVGSGDRSERIRTYNFPQGRVTDHRINLTLYKLSQVLEGEALDEVIDALIAEDQAERLASSDLST